MALPGTMSPVTSGRSIICFENDCLSHDFLPRSVIICEDSDQLINLIASQEGVDVTDETEEGTNAIDVDSLPHLPLNAPSAPARPNPNQFQQPPPQSQPQQFGFGGAQPPPRLPPRPVRPQQQRPSGLAGLFGNFRLPFF